ncbi:MAG: DUF4347 domain-containing protein, partial [Gammaproteobacteria bacterium]|nr:DUF4347 domain-containing protein [Gammaproteobacteria bacterium]
MSKSSKQVMPQSKLILEELEERRLFSGGIEGLIDTSLDSEAQAIYADFDANKTQSDGAESQTSTATEEQQSQEIVFVDTGVDNYQQLIDDLRANAASNRNIEALVPDQEKDGLEQIPPGPQ